jgi:hypothetical protein
MKDMHRQAEEPMTDEKRQPRPLGSRQKTAPRDESVPDGGARASQRRPGAGGRIAVAGIGVAAMLGLVVNMDVNGGRAKSADPASSPARVSLRTAKSAHQRAAAGLGVVAAAKANKPIVLTPHAVVHTVGGASSSGGSGGSYAGSPGYAAAPAPAAAPVASSSGSH